jgi:hypothetical protein
MRRCLHNRATTRTGGYRRLCDLAMSLDNVIAVAAAAGESVTLLIL